MKDIIFIPPDGNELNNPNMGILKDLVFNKGDEFWQVDSADAGIYFKENDFKAELKLVIKESYGCMVHYENYEQDEQYVLSRKGDIKETIKVYIGGDGSILPKIYFVDKELAWEAIVEFCQSGKQKKDLNWVVFNPPDIE